MNRRAVPSGTSAHQAAQDLLPWFVTNSLSADEMALVQEHLRTCPQCQADVDWQRMLRTAYQRPDAIPDVDQAFSRLLPRLDTPHNAYARPTLARLSKVFGSGALWMRWALAGQAGIIAILAILLVLPPGAIPSYRGLGLPGKAAGNIAVIFKPGTTEQELRQILRESGARIVDGPTATDAYVLNVQSVEQQQAISILRSKPAVALAEPLDSGVHR